jgi:hypothetical protein
MFAKKNIKADEQNSCELHLAETLLKIGHFNPTDNQYFKIYRG